MQLDMTSCPAWDAESAPQWALSTTAALAELPMPSLRWSRQSMSSLTLMCHVEQQGLRACGGCPLPGRPPAPTFYILLMQCICYPTHKPFHVLPLQDRNAHHTSQTGSAPPGRPAPAQTWRCWRRRIGCRCGQSPGRSRRLQRRWQPGSNASARSEFSRNVSAILGNNMYSFSSTPERFRAGEQRGRCWRRRTGCTYRQPLSLSRRLHMQWPHGQRSSALSVFSRNVSAISGTAKVHIFNRRTDFCSKRARHSRRRLMGASGPSWPMWRRRQHEGAPARVQTQQNLSEALSFTAPTLVAALVLKQQDCMYEVILSA